MFHKTADERILNLSHLVSKATAVPAMHLIDYWGKTFSYDEVHLENLNHGSLAPIDSALLKLSN